MTIIVKPGVNNIHYVSMSVFYGCTVVRKIKIQQSPFNWSCYLMKVHKTIIGHKQ